MTIIVPPLREEFRAVTTFQPFERWSSQANGYEEHVGHTNVSLTMQTQEAASDRAVGLASLHQPKPDEEQRGRGMKTALIESQVVQRRVVSDWAPVETVVEP